MDGERSHGPPWLGIALGFIPVILTLVAATVVTDVKGARAAGTTLLVMGGIMYGIELLSAIVLLFLKRWRYVGYGLLAMTFIGPIAGAIGCIVIVSNGPKA